MQSYCREKMLTMGQTSLESTSVIVHPQQVNHIIYHTNPKLRRHPHIQILVASESFFSEPFKYLVSVQTVGS